MPVPTSPVRPVPFTVRRVRTWLSSTLTPRRLAGSTGWLCFAFVLSCLVDPEQFARVAPWVADGILAAAGPTDCSHPVRGWAALQSGRPFEGDPLRCAARLLRFPHQRAALQLRAQRAPASSEVLGSLLVVGPGEEAGAAWLSGANIPPALRRAALVPESAGRSPLDLPSVAEQAAVHGLYDAATLLRSEAALTGEAEADEVVAGVAAIDGLIAAGDLPQSGWEAEIVLDRTTAARTHGAGPAPTAAQGLRQPSDRPASINDLPPELAALVLEEAAAAHLAAEWRAIVDWARDAGGGGARVAAAMRSVPSPARPGGIHAVLRGDPALPAVGRLVAVLLAEAVDLPWQASGAAIRVDGWRIRFDRCGGRDTLDPTGRDSLPTTGSSERAVLVREATLAVAGRALLDATDPAVGMARLRVLMAEVPAPASGSDALFDLLGEATLIEVRDAPTLRPATRRERAAAAARPLAASPTTSGDVTDAAHSSLLGAWLHAAGRDTEARRALATPARGELEELRIATLAAMGEPVTPRRTADRCRDPALPWPR